MFATRWVPFTEMGREMNRLRDEMDRLFGRFGANGPRPFGANVYPAVNLWEDDNSLYVEAELPGFELNELEIYVTGGNQLTVKGERKQPELPSGTWHREERGFGSFSRMIELPNRVDSDKVSAEFKHGVLTVTLPKSAEVKPRRIEVKTT